MIYKSEADDIPFTYDDSITGTRIYYVCTEELDWIRATMPSEVVSQTEFEDYAEYNYAGAGDDWNDAEHTMYWCMGDAEKENILVVWFRDEKELLNEQSAQEPE